MSSNSFATAKSATAKLKMKMKMKMLPAGFPVKTTPQMTRFRDAKVCDNLATEELTITEYSLTTSA